MKADIASERMIILRLALLAANRKLDDCQQDIDILEQKQSIMKADGAGFEEKEDVKNSLHDLYSRLNSWQERIDSILDWINEIAQ